MEHFIATALVVLSRLRTLLHNQPRLARSCMQAGRWGGLSPDVAAPLVPTGRLGRVVADYIALKYTLADEMPVGAKK